LRIYYFFPALLPIFLNGKIDLTWEKIIYKNNAWHKNPEESFYWKKLNEIIVFAQKVDRLRYLINDVMRIDVNGNPEKLLIMTYKPIEAFIIMLICLSLTIYFRQSRAILDTSWRETVSQEIRAKSRYILVVFFGKKKNTNNS
jgi:hypothetical protein